LYIFSNKLKQVIDISNLKALKECILVDVGSILSEQEVEFQIGTTPFAYKRKYNRIYAHRKGKILKLLIDSNIVLEFEVI